MMFFIVYFSLILIKIRLLKINGLSVPTVQTFSKKNLVFRFVQSITFRQPISFSSGKKFNFIFYSVNVETHFYAFKLVKPQMKFPFSSQFKCLPKENNVSEVFFILISKVS